MAASRVACASFNLGTNTTITITRDNKAYTHTLKYNFNGATGTIATKTTQTTYVWTPPVSAFYAKIPNVTSGYGTITCETYNGNTLIGTTTTGFYAYTVKETCVPTVKGTVVDTNAATIALTGDANKLVCFLSKPKCTLTATAKNSATIKTTQIENPIGLVATTSPYTFDTCYSKEFRFKATDSRGYSTTEIVNVGTFIEYEPCYFAQPPVVARTESTSTTARATMSGYCFKGSFGAVSNTLTVKYRVKASTGTYGNYTTITPTWNTDGTFTASVNIPNLALTTSYIIEFVVEDKLSSFPVEVVLNAGMGDLRIAKDYIQSKNTFIVGNDKDNAFKSFQPKRMVGTSPCRADFGISDEGGMAGAVIQLFKNNVGLARIDLKEDEHLYNFFTDMSFAEIMSSSPSMANDGSQGYLLLNGGNSSPILVQWGKISIYAAQAGIASSQVVNFPYSYVGIPVVFTAALSFQGGEVEVAAHNITQSNFTAYLRRVNVDSTPIHWFAIGNGTNALPA